MLRRFVMAMRGGVVVIGLLLLATVAAAQPANPVYVDDSPRAWELFQRAMDQRTDNVGETVRVMQALLDDDNERLLPVRAGHTDHLVSVRRRVMDALLRDPELLERYRLIEEPQAGRMLEAGELDRLVRTRALTVSGVRGQLRLAQRNLEAGRFASALRLLDEARTHVEGSAVGIDRDQRDRNRRHAWYMTGVAAWYLGHDHLAMDAMRRLEADDDRAAEPFVAQLSDLMGEAIEDRRVRGMTPADRFAHFDPTRLVNKPIWTVELVDTLLGRRFGGRERDRDESMIDVARGLRRYLTVVPTLAESTVYVNEGHTVRAVDRYSHRQRWRYVERPRTAIADNEREIAGDLNTVVVADDAVVTLTGHAHTDLRSSSGKIICLDRETGEYRWRVVLGEIGGSEMYEGLFPHGAPVVDDGRVFVLGRRVSRQNVTSTYVAALRLEDGALEWLRPIVSSGGLRQNLARPFSALTYERGMLYVETAVGAVASLDAVTGDVRWLRRYTVPLNPPSRSRQPWEYSAPVVTPAGVLALRYGQTLDVVRYNPDTGDEQAVMIAGRGTAWGDVRYLLAGGQWVYAIGQDVRCFHVEDLTTPAWIFPDENVLDAFTTGNGGEQSAGTLPLDPFGRAQLGEAMLVVPTMHGQFLLDAETGRIVTRVRDAYGNPLVADGQMFVAGAMDLSSYMPLHVAEAMIRERMADAVDDPEPALTLLELGLRADNLSLVLEGAEAAEAIINAIGTPGSPERQWWRRRLFDLLIEAHDRDLPGIDEHDGPAADLYAMLRSHAVGEDGEIEYRLAYADWLGDHDPRAAVAQLQHVLERPALARRARVVGDVARPAAAWATDAMIGMIKRHGPGIYAAQREAAERDLANIPTDASPEALLTVVDAYPLAPASVAATVRAADAALESDGAHAAIAALLRGYHMVADAQPSESRHLLGRAVDMLVDHDMPQAAVALLEWADRHVTDGRLIHRGGVRNATQWRDAIIERAGGTPSPMGRALQLPRLIAEPRELAGRPLLPLHDSFPARTDARLLTYEGNLLRIIEPQLERAGNGAGGGDAARHADIGRTIWSTEVEPPIDVLTITDDAVLLALNPHTVDPRVVSIDARTGREQWVTPRLGNVLNDAERMLEPLRGSESFGEPTLPDGRPFDIRETLTLIDEANVYIVRRTGSIAAFSRETGELRWSRDDALHHVHVATAHAYGLALSGIVREPGEGGQSASSQINGRIVVLHPMTGDPITAMTPLDHWPARWMAVTPLGVLVYRCESGIEALDMLSGRILWSNASAPARQCTRSWLIDDWLVIADEENTIRTVDGQRGTIRDVNDAPLTGSQSPTGPARALSGGHGPGWNRSPLMDAMTVEGDALLFFRERLVRIDSRGQVVGADFITDDRQFRFVLPAGDQMLLVNQLRSEQRQLDGDGGRLTVYPYMLHLLSPTGRLLGEIGVESYGQPVREAAIEGSWLVLGTQQSTYVLPLTRSRR